MAKYKYPAPTSDAVSAVMRANRSVDTRPERIIRSLLHRGGARFRKNFRVESGGRVCRPDIVFGPKKLAVFVDGCFWHVCPEHGRVPRGVNADYWNRKLKRNVERDEENDIALEAGGWKVLRIWEHESPETAAEGVLAELRRLD